MIRLEGRRLEKPCVMSDELGQPQGSGSQQHSLRESRSSSLFGELQGTSRHGLHRLTVLQSVTSGITETTVTVIVNARSGQSNLTTRMWANAQRDGHPAEYRWHPLFNAAKFR